MQRTTLIPRCDRCYRDDRVAESRRTTTIVRTGQAPVKSYWCDRCRHRFTMPSNRRAPVYYDEGKAHFLIPNTTDSWVRAPELDAKRR